MHKYVLSCGTCQIVKRKYHGRKAPLQPLPVENLFDRWHMDFVGPLTPSSEGGHMHILLVVDSFSRWCEAFPLQNQTASQVAKVLYREIFTRFGAPKSLVSDRGPQFMSALISQLCQIFSIKKHSTTPYHPQSNAACERFNSYMEAGIRAYIKDDQSNWPDILPGILMAYRMTPAMRSTAFSPYFLLFGKEMATPIDTQLLSSFSQAPDFQDRLQIVLEGLQTCREVAKENIKRHQEENKRYHDRRAREPQYEIGHKVLVSKENKPVGLSKKFCKLWNGPYYITDRRPNNTYKLCHCETRTPLKTFIHANRLKLYQDPTSSDVRNPPRQADSSIDEDTKKQMDNAQVKQKKGNQNSQVTCKQDREKPRVVEKIYRTTKYRGKQVYRVKYKDMKGTTWVYADDIPLKLRQEFSETRTQSGKKKKITHVQKNKNTKNHK